MSNVSRVFVLLVLAAFVSQGTAIAQNAPPQPMTTAAPKAHKRARKCKQTPKGCHKKQAKAAGGQMQPAGGMPPATHPPAR